MTLSNGCEVSDFKVMPANWQSRSASTKKDWIIYYTFFDPEYKEGKRCQVRGMNRVKNLAERQRVTRKLIAFEIQNLQSGFNPFKKTVINPTRFEVNRNTPFIPALKKAFEKVKGVEGTLNDIKSVIKGVELSARQLGIYSMPISEVSRKYFKSIFEQCYKNNPKFTAARQNKYRAYLMKLFKELIEMEAVDVNPLRDIQKERETKKERVMPNEDERQKINEYLKENYYSFWRAIQIFFASGSREIELMRVQKKHVDLKDQSCLYLVKKGIEERWVRRPIPDSALPLWIEIMKDSKEEDFLFSKKMIPGPVQIRSEQFSRRWKRHIKDKLKININLYSLKHLNTTEISDQLDKLYNPAEDVQKLTGHTTTAMIVQIYDQHNKSRKDNKIKTIGGTF